MSNLPVFLGVDKVVKAIDHGKVVLDLQVRAGRIIGVTTNGTKKTLYNTSEKDINTNQSALEYMIKRVAQQLESGVSSELVFRVNSNQNKIKSIEVESKQTLK